MSCLLFSVNERLHRRRFAPSNCWPFGHGTSGTLAQKRVDFHDADSAGKGRTKKWEENEENIEKVHEQIQSFHETEMKKRPYLLEVTKKIFHMETRPVDNEPPACFVFMKSSARYTMNRPFPLYRREPSIRFKARWCFSNMFVIFLPRNLGK